jgi:Aspartyl/Asparaginyl beta-hydroxylase
MTFPDRLQLPLVFDPALLERDLAAMAREDWIPHFVTGNYEGDWSVIALRGKAGATHPVTMIYSDPFCHDFVDTPFLEACPYYREVLAAFACPLQSVRLMRLGPGSVIKEHKDHQLSFEQGAVRFHVPVVTNPNVVFSLNGRRIVLEAGSCWYLRLSDPHSVVNLGTGARLHLVIDALVDRWVEDLFATSMAPAA